MTGPTTSTGEAHPGRVRLGVPAFVEPTADPEYWQHVAELDDIARFVVLRPAAGPIGWLGPGYDVVIDVLGRRGIPIVGYIDTAYGLVSPHDVAVATRAWVGHGVRGVFLDHSGHDRDTFEHYTEVVLAARLAGAELVVTDPRTSPHPSYLALADITVTFHGSWEAYRRHDRSASSADVPASRVCHLVADVPTDRVAFAALIAAEKGAETVFFSDAIEPEAWRRVPEGLVRGVRLARGAAGG